MSQPIALTNGQHEIKIYTVKNRGRAVFQLSFYEAVIVSAKLTASCPTRAAKPRSFSVASQ